MSEFDECVKRRGLVRFSDAGFDAVARVLVLSRGYAEKSHYCLIVAFREFFAGTAKVARRFVDFAQRQFDPGQADREA